jgi:DNA-binding LacI/PurR family transcriptional regulator
MRRVALLRNPDNPLEVSTLDKAQQAARELNVRLVTFEAHNAKELDGILHTLKRGIADGMLVSGDSLFRTTQLKIARAAENVGLPAVFPFYLGSDNGALMSYGPSIKEGT